MKLTVLILACLELTGCDPYDKEGQPKFKSEVETPITLLKKLFWETRDRGASYGDGG